MTQEYLALANSMGRSNAFAQQICTELVKANVSDVKTDFDFVVPDSRTFKPPWIATVPIHGILINVGRRLPEYFQQQTGRPTCENPG